MKKKQWCPRCEASSYDFQPAIRQGLVELKDGVTANAIDVGFTCDHCGYEWGFDIFRDKND